jgi:hypothetical protein
MVVFNVFGQQMEQIRKATNTILDAAERSLVLDGATLQVNPVSEVVVTTWLKLILHKQMTSIALDLNSADAMRRVVTFVTSNIKPHSSAVGLLPPSLTYVPVSPCGDNMRLTSFVGWTA